MFKLLWQNVEAVFTVITLNKYFTQLLYSYIAFNKRIAVTKSDVFKYLVPYIISLNPIIGASVASTLQVDASSML